MINIPMISSIAFRAIKANKMRSILTSLGIIIGVAAVIFMLAGGHWAPISIKKDMQSMGSNPIIICTGVATTRGERGGHGGHTRREKGGGVGH